MYPEYKNYWNTTTVPPNGKWLSCAPDEVNYLILGAGGAGMSTALALCNSGLTGVLVVDETLPVFRSARKQIGIVSTMPVLPVDLLAKGFSPEQIQNLASIGLLNAAFTEKFMWRFAEGENWCEKESMGSFRVAFQRSEIDRLEQSLEHYLTLPMESTLFNGDAFRTVTGLRNGHAGLYNPHDFALNPARYLNGLTTAARYLGTDILSGFSAHNILYESPWWIVTDKHGNTIRARHLIITLGAFFGDVGNFDELDSLFLRRRMQYMATSQLETRLPPFALMDIDGTNSIRSHNGRVIYAMNNGDECMADLKTNKSTLNIMKGRLTYRLHCTHDRELQPEYIWTRNILETPDGLPIIAHFESLPNIYLNVGYNEHSLSYQMIGGRIIAGLVKNGQYDIPGSNIFSLERMQ
jgi:glycine/D-amino acid oxidase-like deaminating enzyme